MGTVYVHFYNVVQTIVQQTCHTHTKLRAYLDLAVRLHDNTF